MKNVARIVGTALVPNAAGEPEALVGPQPTDAKTAAAGLARLLTSRMAFEISYFHARVLEEIESWPVDVLADYARLVELLAQHGPSLRLPHSRAFGDGLFELRPRGRAGIARAFYCFLVGKRVIALHAFIKKTQQTPDGELKLARKRLKDVQNG